MPAVKAGRLKSPAEPHVEVAVAAAPAPEKSPEAKQAAASLASAGDAAAAAPAVSANSTPPGAAPAASAAPGALSSTRGRASRRASREVEVRAAEVEATTYLTARTIEEMLAIPADGEARPALPSPEPRPALTPIKSRGFILQLRDHQCRSHSAPRASAHQPLQPRSVLHLSKDLIDYNRSFITSSPFEFVLSYPKI